MRSPLFLACLALCVAAVVAAEGEPKQSTWFREHLAPARATLSQSRYYGELERKTVCYRQHSFCHMKCNNPTGACALDTFTEIANLQCITCPEDLEDYAYHHRHDDSEDPIGMDMTSTLSKCFMYKVRHNKPDDEVPMANKPGVFMAGTFTGTCYMADDDKCGLPEGCGNTEVTITGVAYRIAQAVRIGPAWGGAGGDIPNTCQGNNPNPIREGPTFDEPQRSSKAKPAAADVHTASVQPAYQAEAGNVTVATAYVYTGPFTLHSHTHPLKYTRGYFQFSFFDGTETSTPANTVTHLPRLGDETYKFEFINDATDYYKKYM